MSDPLSTLAALRRPRLLVRTARIGARDYCRERHLARLLGCGPLPGPAEALHRLLESERRFEQQRREGDAGYSLPRHLDVLIAMMAEAQLLRAGRTTEDEDGQDAAGIRTDTAGTGNGNGNEDRNGNESGEEDRKEHGNDSDGVRSGNPARPVAAAAVPSSAVLRPADTAGTAGTAGPEPSPPGPRRPAAEQNRPAPGCALS